MQLSYEAEKYPVEDSNPNVLTHHGLEHRCSSIEQHRA